MSQSKFLNICPRENFQERRKTTKNFFVIFFTKEGLKTNKKKLSVIFCTKRGVFLFGVDRTETGYLETPS
jgi:hypothetical protein